MGYPVSLNLPICLLESDGWTKGEAQIVVRAAIEVHQVANFKPQSNRAGVKLDAAARIEHAVGVAAGNGREL